MKSKDDKVIIFEIGLRLKPTVLYSQKLYTFFYLIVYRKYEDSFVYRFARKFRTQINFQ